ncbi:DUF5302 domain-containing protein [Mycolicibacterium vaccae]|uniref:DUF5302 domain-containing protein n=1 Tax=Mycolicibacterium vaccae TaxID=1810 RepID=UPI003CE9648B
MTSKAGPADSSDDDTKRQFREALQRKNAKSAGGSGRAGGPAPQSRAHGPVENRREFRRKSG